MNATGRSMARGVRCSNFDAFIVGLTATPSLHTMGFFGSNLVAQYPYERSVADEVNVPYPV
jgi:type I restriction enzyme R subunit